MVSIPYKSNIRCSILVLTFAGCVIYCEQLLQVTSYTLDPVFSTVRLLILNVAKLDLMTTASSAYETVAQIPMKIFSSASRY